MKEQSVAIFDLDGTIKTREGIPPEIFIGIENLQSQDITTTILTGKGKAHLQRTLQSNWKRLISHNTPVGVENGGRIIDSGGTENLLYHSLSKEEINSQITLLESGEIPFLLYVPENLKLPAKIWAKNEKEAEQFNTDEYSPYDVFTSSLSKLHQQITEDNPCMFVFQPYSAEFRSSIPKDLNISQNEGVLHLNSESTNKGSGVSDIVSITGSDIAEVIIAGNDENDIPMFHLPVKEKILVGSYDGILTIPDIHQFADVKSFGNYLSSYK
jgi:HAD superfamily hydrolase (TIGR01484 family)